jgi:serine/threonine protein kinase
VINMAEWNANANKVFLAAAEVESPAERRQFLDQRCGNDADLRAQVESLLAASAKVGSFLNKPAAHALPGSRGTADYEPIAERPGTVIGPYKLKEQIGEGGMGLVFVAEQQEPVRRKVALKIIKPGMDSKQVIARFEAERQALAMMDHQNIAKVFDAGTTESGGRTSSWSWSTACRSRSTATSTSSPRGSGWSCSSPSARRYSMPTKRASSIATSSRRTCW